MNKSFITTCLIIGCTALAGWGQAVYSFNLDPKLESAVRETLNKPEGSLTFEDMAQINTLDLAGKGLAGRLQLHPTLVNLTTLDLRTNQLQQLILSEGLTSLSLIRAQESPLIQLAVPLGFDLDAVEIQGFDKADVTFYLPFESRTVPETRGFEMEWTLGVLQTRESLDDEWVNVEDAFGEYFVEPVGTTRFYRLIFQSEE